MAKKVTGYIKLQIPAGKATPAPPVGPALGQHGVNIVQFTKEFNARTADQGDLIKMCIRDSTGTVCDHSDLDLGIQIYLLQTLSGT